MLVNVNLLNVSHSSRVISLVVAH